MNNLWQEDEAKLNILFGSQDQADTLADEKIHEPTEKQPQQRRSTNIKRRHFHTYRRAFSETQLLDIVDMPFQDGDSYHFITGGDVDALSYLKIILRQQDLDYCLFSTWCMASEDIYQFEDWLKAGRIKRLDAYVGEIFPNSYRLEYKMLRPLLESYGGRVAVFRNHAKLFAGFGEKFYFSIETSANINTNPRTENACITIDRELFKFYKTYFDGIISFDK